MRPCRIFTFRRCGAIPAGTTTGTVRLSMYGTTSHLRDGCAMAMSGKERAKLRTEAQKLTALVHVGQAGVTEAIVKTMDEVLSTHELVKVDITRNLTAPIKDLATALADATGAEVVQVIGRRARINPRHLSPRPDTCQTGHVEI